MIVVSLIKRGMLLIAMVAMCTAANAFDIERFNSAVDSYADRVEKSLADRPKNRLQKQNTSTPELGFTAVLAVSSSMPMAVIQRYGQQLEAINGKMVIRGAIGGLDRLKPTLQWFDSVLKLDPDCIEQCAHRNVEILIDPLVFDQWGIDRVPALVVVDRYSGEPYCESQPEQAKAIAYGDAGINLLFRQIAKRDSSRRESYIQAALTIENEGL